MISHETFSLINQTMAGLSYKIHKESGCRILIGYSIEDGDIILEGAVSSGEPDYGLACKMIMGINSFVADYYGNLDLDDIIETEGKKTP